MQELVLYEVSDRIAIVTLDRPAQRNAIDAAMTAALRSAMDRFETDHEALVAILNLGLVNTVVPHGLLRETAREGPRAFAEKRPAVWRER